MALMTTPPDGPLFLGARRLEIDGAGERLPSRFAELYADAVTALDRYRRGEGTAEETAQRLASLRTIDEAGTEWTVGASSLEWYARRPGEPWAVTPAPVVTAQRSLPAGDAFDIDDLDDALLASLDPVAAAPADPAAVAPGPAASAEELSDPVVMTPRGVPEPANDALVLDKLADHTAALDATENHSESWDGEFSLEGLTGAPSSGDFSTSVPGDDLLLTPPPGPVAGPADLGGPSGDGIGGASVELRDLDLDDDLLALLTDQGVVNDGSATAAANDGAGPDDHNGEAHDGDDDGDDGEGPSSDGTGYADAV
jgi:hypothetical protein